MLHDALARVLSQNPDAIFFAGYPSDLVDLLPAIPQPNNLLIMGGSALSITNTYTSLPPNLDHVYFTAYGSPNPNQWDSNNPQPQIFQTFAQNYQHNFGTTIAPTTGLPSIDAGVMLGYDGMQTLLYASQQVLSTKNTITPPDLQAALKQITGANAIQGVTGRISFNSYGDQDEHKVIFVEHIEGTNLVIDEIHGCLLKDNCSS